VPINNLLCAEQRVTVGYPSNPASSAGKHLEFWEGVLRLTGVAGVVLLMMALASPTGWASGALPPAQQAPQTPSQLGTIAPYLGAPIEEIELPGVPAEEVAHLLAATPLKAGEPLSRQALHDAMQSLFATGRFADIQAEADRTSTGVRLRFLTVPNYFVGQITVEGVSSNPSPNQLITASRLQLGELYTAEKLDRAVAGLERVLEDNGFHRSKVHTSEQRNPEQHQIDLIFHVTPGPRAVVGQIVLQGDSSYSQGEIEDIGKFHAGDPVISTRLTRALQRIRSKYQKQDRLLAQVSVASRTYRPESNAVDYTVLVERGPVVEIAAEGFKISQRQLRRLVPVYEEGAVDEDLLNEGRRNIQNNLQSLGYFAATVSVSQRSVQDGKGLRVIYAITPGDRHKLTAIRILGNHFLEEEQIRAVMQEQPAGRLFSHGRYNEALLAADVRSIQDLYRATGYRQVEVASKLLENYQGDPSQIAIELTIKEGKQTLVSSLNIEGNLTVPTEQLVELAQISTAEGQGFDESSLADDRDKILGVYFDNGFTNATVDVTYAPVTPSPDDLPRVAVTFTIHEGEQFFVNRLFLTGLHYTRPGVARREFRVKPGAPLSQQAMLETQRHLYDLGLFNEVETAIQNPEGTESRKNVLITTREAKRYTFDYGVGIEFQTGQPSVGTNQPLGRTGASPKVSFGVSRINFGGRHQTVTMKTSLSRLQQRGVITYEAPKFLNRDLRFSTRALYDNTVDVSTFTSERVQGTVQAEQVLYKVGDRVLTSLTYGFSYRRVKASNIQVTDNLIPLLSKPTRVGEPNFLYIRNRRDNDLETNHGNYTTVEGGVAASFFGSEADFSRLLIKNSSYHPFARNRRTGLGFVFARSTSIGLQNPFGNTVLLDPATPLPVGHTLIPLPERFFMGGGSSHRGFGLNQAGPRDPFTGFPVGGSALFLNNLELRFPGFIIPYLHDNIGFTVFHDMGNVFARPQEMVRSLGQWHQPHPAACFVETGTNNDQSKCNYNYLSHAIGLGVRYQTPIGPLRLDFGYNLNPPFFPSFTNIVNNSVTPGAPPTGQFGTQRAGHFNFSFSIGQSF
jgi:outer membrane protein insertion porin family